MVSGIFYSLVYSRNTLLYILKIVKRHVCINICEFLLSHFPLFVVIHCLLSMTTKRETQDTKN